MSAATMSEMERLRRERGEARAENAALAAHVERIKACFKSTSATLPSDWQAEMYGLFAQAAATLKEEKHD